MLISERLIRGLCIGVALVIAVHVYNVYILCCSMLYTMLYRVVWEKVWVWARYAILQHAGGV